MKLRILALAMVLVLPRTALANDPAAAEALFDHGRALMDQGHFAEACPKFAESQKLDPAVGTLLNLAECYDKAEKYALAWATFREADAAASHEGQSSRAAYARKRAEELEKRLALLTIEVAPDARVEGLEIRRDGDAIREPVWGIPLPVDPGPHTIEARAPGYKTFTTTVVATRQSAPVVIRPLEKAPADSSPTPPPPKVDVVVTPPPVPIPPPPEVAAHGTAQRTAGIVLTGAGVAGLAVSGVFAGLALTKDHAATNAGCDASTCPTTAGVQDSNDALTLARVSTWSFVVGAVVAVGGVTLWLTAPRATPSPSAWLAPSLGGAVLGGSF
jgi:hypothetical protein